MFCYEILFHELIIRLDVEKYAFSCKFYVEITRVLSPRRCFNVLVRFGAPVFLQRIFFRVGLTIGVDFFQNEQMKDVNALVLIKCTLSEG